MADEEALTGALDAGDVDGVALAKPEAEAADEPLGKGVRIGVGLGVGDGKSLVGTFANESAKISTKMMTTTATQIRARLSSRGGKDPR